MKIHHVNMQPILQDFLLLLNLSAVISKCYPSTTCQLNDRKLEGVFPAYCYCHSIFRPLKIETMPFLSAFKHITAIYSTWNTGANIPYLPLILNQTLLWTSTMASYFLFRTQEFEASCTQCLQPSVQLYTYCRMSTKLQTTLGKVDPSKLAKEKSHGNKPQDFVLFFFLNFFHLI